MSKKHLWILDTPQRKQEMYSFILNGFNDRNKITPLVFYRKLRATLKDLEIIRENWHTICHTSQYVGNPHKTFAEQSQLYLA